MSEEVTMLDGNGSVARVAFDLAEKIATWEMGAGDYRSKSRQGFLDLYAECHKAARGHRDW